MSRISLRETYDNRSVIAQIAKVTDTAEDAAETVQQKAAEINDALTDVNAAVQAAEGAVTTANAASAAAQQSVQTVAGYENRLGAVETGLSQTESDLNAVTLRVQTAEGDIVTIQGRVTALETADGQNVKLTGEHAIGNYAVLLTGNQTKTGVLFFKNSPTLQTPSYAGYSILNQNIESWDTTPPEVTERQRVFQISDKANTQYMFRLNVDITNTGAVRLNYERHQIVNGVNTYDSGYLI